MNPEKNSSGGKKKAAAFSLILIALLWLFLELFACGVLVLRLGASIKAPTAIARAQRKEILKAAESVAEARPDRTPEHRVTTQELSERPELLHDRYRSGIVAVHPYVGYIPNPDWIEELSPLGYGGDPPPVQKREPGKVIVGIFGGSVAVGLAPAGGTVLTELLRGVPGWETNEFVYLTLAVPGHKQPQALMSLNYLLALGAEFDIVIALDGFNEIVLPITENVPQGVFPIYPRAWELLSQATLDPGRLSRLARLEAVRLQRQERARSFQRAPWRRSPLANLIWLQMDRRSVVQEQEIAQAIETATAARKGNFRQHGPKFDAPASEEELYRLLADYWRRCSLQMNVLGKGFGFRYFHFLQPNQYAPGQGKPLSEEELKTAWRANHPYLAAAEKGYPWLQRAGQELTAQGANFFDLTSVFADLPQTLYVDDCCHFNAEGQRLVAHAIGTAILESMRAGQ